MMKESSSLNSSREIWLHGKFSLHSKTVGFFHDFRGNDYLVTPKDEIFMRILGVKK